MGIRSDGEVSPAWFAGYGAACCQTGKEDGRRYSGIRHDPFGEPRILYGPLKVQPQTMPCDITSFDIHPMIHWPYSIDKTN
jgi:hypothetical protein